MPPRATKNNVQSQSTEDIYNNPIFKELPYISKNKASPANYGVKGKDTGSVIKAKHHFFKRIPNIIVENFDGDAVVFEDARFKSFKSPRPSVVSSRRSSYTFESAWAETVAKPKLLLPLTNVDMPYDPDKRYDGTESWGAVFHDDNCDCCVGRKKKKEREMLFGLEEKIGISTRPRVWNARNQKNEQMSDAKSFALWHDYEALDSQRVMRSHIELKKPEVAAEGGNRNGNKKDEWVIHLPHRELVLFSDQSGLSAFHSHADRAAAEKVDKHGWGVRFPNTIKDLPLIGRTLKVNNDATIDRYRKKCQLLLESGVDPTTSLATPRPKLLRDYRTFDGRRSASPMTPTRKHVGSRAGEPGYPFTPQNLRTPCSLFETPAPVYTPEWSRDHTGRLERSPYLASSTTETSVAPPPRRAMSAESDDGNNNISRNINNENTHPNRELRAVMRHRQQHLAAGVGGSLVNIGDEPETDMDHGGVGMQVVITQLPNDIPGALHHTPSPSSVANSDEFADDSDQSL